MSLDLDGQGGQGHPPPYQNIRQAYTHPRCYSPLRPVGLNNTLIRAARRDKNLLLSQHLLDVLVTMVN